MPLAAQIAWWIGMVPGWIAVYWAYKKVFWKFMGWATVSAAFWAIGVALDIWAHG
jgi:hypothetical protein